MEFSVIIVGMENFWNKIYISLFILFIAYSFVSCSSPEELFDSEYSETVKSYFNSAEEDVLWTKELETSVLTQSVQNDRGIEPSLGISPKNIFLSKVSGNTELYPAIEDFATLDTSDLPENAKSSLNGFCGALVSGRGADSFMAIGSVYSLVLFRYSLSETYGKPGVFSSYVLGKPFINEKTLQVPVRFYLKRGGNLDVFVYLEPSPSCRIRQIELREQILLKQK